MNIRRFVLTLAVIPLAAMMAAQGTEGRFIPAGKPFLRQLQQRDSVLIADQLVYGCSLEGVEEGTSIMLPDFSEGFTDGVEVLTPWKIDTLKVHRGKKGAPSKYDIEAGVVITSFDEGEYNLAPIALLKASGNAPADTLMFDTVSLQVCTMPVDTASFQPHDIKGQIRYPVTFGEVLPWILAIHLLALIGIAIYCIIKLYRRRNDPQLQHHDPAHIVALRKLDKFRSDKMWAPEKQKLFYSGITDALREYISARYGIGAMEMTTAEIFKEMKSTDASSELLDAVRELFETADFVKFAKLVVPDQDNAKVLPLAVRFVTETYQSEIESEAEGDNKNR